MRIRSFDRFFSFSAALAASVGGVAACGGMVVVDPADDEGGGGAGTTLVAGSGGGGVITPSGAGVGGQGAGTSSSSGSGPGPQDAVCAAFCEEAADVGCPKNGNCMERCLDMFVNGCPAETEAMLACTPTTLDETCQIKNPEGDICDEQVFSYVGCIFGEFDVPCDSGQAQSDAQGTCTGTAECSVGQLLIDCDALGSCLCVVNGELIGTCQSLINGATFCLPQASCCAPLYAQ
jgi:hypothetical protein